MIGQRTFSIESAGSSMSADRQRFQCQRLICIAARNRRAATARAAARGMVLSRQLSLCIGTNSLIDAIDEGRVAAGN